MLKYTGHPLVDVGAATIAAFDTENRITPEEVTEGLLDKFTDYISSHYSIEPFASYIRILLVNSVYVNAGPEKRENFLNTMLRVYKNPAEPLEERCSFCSNPAFHRIFKQHVSLLGGEQSFNFFAEGRKGLPVCPTCFVSLQAYPLGSAKCEGKLKALVVHSCDSDITYEFARRFSTQNRVAAGLGQEIRFPRTMLIESLLDIEKERKRKEEDGIAAITAYRLTNFGTDPDIEIYHLPASNIRFVHIARTGKYRAAWDAIVERAWEEVDEAKPKRQSKRTNKKTKPGRKAKQPVGKRNFIYEDLFDLPESSHRFLRTYFLRLRVPRKQNRKAQEVETKKETKTSNSDPSATYSAVNEASIISWDLTALFLREVMNMNKVRINAIRDLGDRLTGYVMNQDSRLFSKIFSARRYKDLSLELLKANKESVQSGRAPLFTFDQFVDIFEESEDMPRADWSLARDLVLVRMIEQLQAANFWASHQEQLEEATRDVASVD